MIGADSGLPFNYCDILLNWFSGCFTLVMYQIQTYTKIEIVVCYDILHLMQVAFILHVFRLWGLCVTETRTLCPILITPPIWCLSCLSPTACSRVHSGVIFAEIMIIHLRQNAIWRRYLTRDIFVLSYYPKVASLTHAKNLTICVTCTMYLRNKKSFVEYYKMHYKIDL